MKFEINISDDDWKLMLKNRYGHDNVITRGYMLDIVHDIIDQIHEHKVYIVSSAPQGVYKPPQNFSTRVKKSSWRAKKRKRDFFLYIPQYRILAFTTIGPKQSNISSHAIGIIEVIK